MKHRVLDVRFLGSVACCVISSMIMISSTASPPVVSISQLLRLEAGTVVTTTGVVVDYWSRDDGSESLVIADILSNATVRVICAASKSGNASSGIRIGDEVAVTGEVSTQQSPPVLFARSDDVRLLRKAESVLTVNTLASHWLLFLNDRFEVRGVIDLSEPSGVYRLVDESQNCGLLLRCGDDLSGLAAANVLVRGCLVLDSGSMSLVLVVEGVSAVQ